MNEKIIYLQTKQNVRVTLQDDCDGSRWNIFNQRKKIKNTRYTFHKYYTLRELDIFRIIRPFPRVYKTKFKYTLNT
jgi:hypothetical protein